MKINIKNNFGSIISSKSTTIINGRKLSGKCKTQEFDERKEEDADNIEKIVIVSALTDINISASNSSKVEVHFCGSATTDGEINFEVKKINRELIITVECSSGNCFDVNLKLDINLPLEKNFELISVNNALGKVVLNKNVSIKSLDVRTQSGDIKSYADLQNVFIKTMNGKVEVIINAKNDVSLDINTMNGNVAVELNNISRFKKVHTRTMNGNVRDNHKGNYEGYTADIYIDTMNGDIKIS